ncbi:hypothetical protein [Nocardioides mangrovi]|uniref:GlsB/YeaQ/YmgE family stress response membrane protein n=1 Tax=Nocardioides mangrovi TaxID=2874580 RepID=A0ABS7U936_9ACTN|nr:hypothetical protein [Nocardioides mangrovi]MBZ5737461.1 hypothetical protein [Nocardioides mangrovi]
MVAFLIAGVILGVLARVLRHGPDDPAPLLTVLVGVVGAVIGGVGMNLVLSDPWSGLTAWSFTAACLLPFVLLGLLQGGVGRRA